MSRHQMPGGSHDWRRTMPPPLPFSLTVSPFLTRIALLVLAAGVTLCLQLLLPDQLRSLEERVGSFGWTLSPDLRTEERFTIVAIDEKSIAELGPWPWPRAALAELSQALQAAHVTLQIYDIVLPEAKPGDEQLLAALKGANAVLGQVPVLQGDESSQTGVMTHSLRALRCNPPIPSTRNFLASHAGFDSIPKGHITSVVDADGAVRTVPPLICVDDRPYPSLVISALLRSVHPSGAKIAELTGDGGGPLASVEPGKGLFAPHYNIRLSEFPGITIPVDDHGLMRISYSRVPSAYQVVSAVDVVRGRVEADMLDGTWVLVGATAFGLGDVVPTPYGGAAPVIEIQARLLGSLLDSNVPYTPRFAPGLLAAVAAVFALVLLGLSSVRGRIAAFGLPLAACVMPLLALGLHVGLVRTNIWLGWLSPALYALVAGFAISLLEQARVRAEKMRVFENLNSYLPSGVAGEIAFNLPSGLIEASRKDLTLLCADLRNFSAFEERRPPDESAALLHCFFIRASDVIERFGGSVHEFKGDAVLAVAYSKR
ncbi:MAG: CHASE2 domain-containing protein [Gammaproteobacteria bacterium]|nr:CHASE2 domain-containing protein [Gammaproteobacteria bacterium]